MHGYPARELVREGRALGRREFPAHARLGPEEREQAHPPDRAPGAGVQAQAEPVQLVGAVEQGDQVRREEARGSVDVDRRALQRADLLRHRSRGRVERAA